MTSYLIVLEIKWVINSNFFLRNKYTNIMVIIVNNVPVPFLLLVSSFQGSKGHDCDWVHK